MQHIHESMNQYIKPMMQYSWTKKSSAITCLVGIEFANRLTASNLIFCSQGRLRNDQNHKRQGKGVNISIISCDMTPEVVYFWDKKCGFIRIYSISFSFIRFHAVESYPQLILNYPIFSNIAVIIASLFAISFTPMILTFIYPMIESSP